MNRRAIEVSVISDLHLATHASKPKKILNYLKSIHPATLVLNGDIIDSWRFTRNYFPKSQLKVIRQLIKMMERGTRIYYITGNHDEFLRKFAGAKFGMLEIVNQYIFTHDGKKTWIFHGDIFDDIIHSSKGLAKIGAALYGLLTIVNKGLNYLPHLLGWKELVIYKTLKKNFVREKRTPSRFENALLCSALAQEYDEVICGHTHAPKDKMLGENDHQIRYINCGDWVEHCTAAEFYAGKWHLHVHFDQPTENSFENLVDEIEFPAEQRIYETLVEELTFKNLSIQP